MTNWESVAPGNIQESALLAMMKGLAKLRPDFIPAFDSLAEVAEIESYWYNIRPDCVPVATFPPTQILELQAPQPEKGEGY